MNQLRTSAIATGQPDTFNVYWSNSDFRPGGLLEVRIRPDIPGRQIAAELSAIRHLLEERQVLGSNVTTGQGIKLTVSQGAIRKLCAQRSDKAHLAPYANFLVTRFGGCQIEVSKKTDWFAGLPQDSAENLLINRPRRETLSIAGVGEVAVSSHALQRFAERILPDIDPDRRIPAAWKKLVRIVSDPSVHEVARCNRNAPLRFTKACHHEGRYFLNQTHNLVLVVTERPHEGKKLVTTYPATREFVALAEAA